MSDDESITWSAHAILEALERSQKAANRYDMTRHQVAKQGQHPDESPRVQDAHIELHGAVMDLFRRARAQIRKHMPEYWEPPESEEEAREMDGTEKAVLYMSGHTLAESERYIIGMKSLEQFYGQVQTHVYEEEQRHKGDVTEEIHDPLLLPPQACRRTIDLVSECLNELGYMEVPKERRTVHVLDANGGQSQGSDA